jgi:hypothetical protein
MEARRVAAVDEKSNEPLNWLQENKEQLRADTEPELSGMDRNSLRQQGISSPFPVSPKGKPGRGRFPPRRDTLRANKKRLARIDAAGSPTRGLPPPCASPASAVAQTL